MESSAKNNENIALSLENLAASLDCGLQTARRIGREANAQIKIGRRVLYNLRTIQKYLDKIQE